MGMTEGLVLQPQASVQLIVPCLSPYCFVVELWTPLIFWYIIIIIKLLFWSIEEARTTLFFTGLFSNLPVDWLYC